MALYLIGDVQGCDEALGRLLGELAFSPSRDQLVLLGDLINRGPDSLAVLQRMRRLGSAAQCLLGNHNLHLLGVAHGVRAPGRRDTLMPLLDSPQREALLEWLRQQSMALHRHIGGQDLLMVHAGVLPGWGVSQVLALAAEVEAVLRGPDLRTFLAQMYGNTPPQWAPGLQGFARLRVIVNALTRLRFCSAEGRMDLETKEGLDASPPGFMPWFDVPGRRSASAVVAFGHWSTLGWCSRPDLLSLDTGCVWGGCLTAVRLGATLDERERIEVRCEQAQSLRD